MATVADEEARDPAAVGQPRDPHIEIHPIDALHLEHRVISKDITDAARYGHNGLWSDGRPVGEPTATCGSYTGPACRSRSRSRPDRSPQYQANHRT
jgi:hypothetical protein